MPLKMQAEANQILMSTIVDENRHGLEECSLSYAKMNSIEAGLKFKTRGGLVVETTGVTQHVESEDVHVHEVVVLEGPGEGSKYLIQLDYHEQV